MAQVTARWVKKYDNCSEFQAGYEWYQQQEDKNEITILRKLISEDRLAWANWFIVRRMTKKQRVQYAIYAAKQVIKIYQKKYPDDDRPQKAIAAAEKYLKNPSKKNAYAANAAAYAAYAAYAAAYAAAEKKMKVKILKYGIKIISTCGA